MMNEKFIFSVTYIVFKNWENVHCMVGTFILMVIYMVAVKSWPYAALMLGVHSVFWFNWIVWDRLWYISHCCATKAQAYAVDDDLDSGQNLDF